MGRGCRVITCGKYAVVNSWGHPVISVLVTMARCDWLAANFRGD
jgi:hypothetical protein